MAAVFTAVLVAGSAIVLKKVFLSALPLYCCCPYAVFCCEGGVYADLGCPYEYCELLKLCGAEGCAGISFNASGCGALFEEYASLGNSGAAVISASVGNSASADAAAFFAISYFIIHKNSPV